MSYLYLTRSRERERSPEFDKHFSRPLARRNSKRQRVVSFSDEEDNCYDDYPYSSNHKPAKLSRSLTTRNQPSQLERFNIWSDKYDRRSDDEKEETKRSEKTRVYKYHHSDDESSIDADERAFRLKVQATLSKPRPSYHHHHHIDHDLTHLWPSTAPSRCPEETWVTEKWETRERECSRERRRDSVWESEEERDEEVERWARYRRVKRTKTEEFRPLSGWRKERIIFGC